VTHHKFASAGPYGPKWRLEMAVRDIGDYTCVQAGEPIPRILSPLRWSRFTVMPRIEIEIAEIEKRNTRYSLRVRFDIGVNGIQKFNVVSLW
jgi:hypothetical protein